MLITKLTAHDWLQKPMALSSNYNYNNTSGYTMFMVVMWASWSSRWCFPGVSKQWMSSGRDTLESAT